MLVVAAGVAYLGKKAGFPLDVRGSFDTKEFLPILLAVFKMIGNVAWMTAFVFVLVTAGAMVYRVLITAQDVDDYQAIKNALKQSRDLLWLEIAFGILGAAIEPFVQ